MEKDKKLEITYDSNFVTEDGENITVPSTIEIPLASDNETKIYHAECTMDMLDLIIETMNTKPGIKMKLVTI